MSSNPILCGAHREHPALSERVGLPAPDEIIKLTLILRRRKPASDEHPITSRFTHESLAEAHGADPEDLQAVEEFAAENHFTIAHMNPAARTVTIAGLLPALAAAFGANLELRRAGDRVIRTREGDLQLPECLAHRVEAVLGFDQRPVARTYHAVKARASQSLSYTPRQVAQLYNFPTNTGKGQTIALIELGGGFQSADLKKYWKQIGIGNVAVTAVSVDGAQNSPTGDPNSADGEVVLDIEVAGGIAPAAKIAVYFAGNTDQGFLDAINAAVHDRVRKPSVISISWGGPESSWTPQALNAFNAAFHDAALLGISVCCASGDNGSSDGSDDGSDHVDFPASSPWVLACGGTNLASANGKITSETVWNDGADGGATGGGVSTHFSRPWYQAFTTLPVANGKTALTGRGVPDVAGVADPNTGYIIQVDGSEGVIGGTSAVAPLWAGLIALLNEEIGKNAGFFHWDLYSTLKGTALNDITSGNNGTYIAAHGWDACTGQGSPNGQAILALLKTLIA
ncbi:MAG TPA: S53 family peptidase [Bryobacteraceae bacterium]|jgi:kumamolisin|nr:S53 family peptidase [Bryobacteraceae bacterium]